MSAGFVHLHCHTEYSVLDGVSKVGDLLERCRDYGMKACAITDHGNIFGALDFYQSARKAGIKPIIGCELYVAKGSRFDRSARVSGKGHNHFLVLCENEAGYHNLCKLSSLGYLEGYHYRPRVDLELLARHSEGLIATSSCLAGEIPQFLLEDNLDGANEAIRRYIDIFGRDNFLIEIMDHGLPEDRKINPVLAEMAEHHSLLLVATNDCHYVDKTDADAHDALLAIQTNATLDSEKRLRFPGGPQYYVSSGEEMREKFSQWPQAVSNTELVAARCNVELKTDQHLIPQFTPPEGRTNEEYLHELVMKGLVERYGDSPAPHYIERAEFELGVINSMSFTDYFLVVWDLIRFAREQGIPVGPGRGSGAGSLVAYALMITNIDPIRYKLLFERFLNPDRISMPDFDLDFCEERRGEMIEYVRAKYGQENVSQIITFGRMKAKAVVRNVGRVMGMPFSEVNRIAKLIPSDDLKITLKGALEREPELAEMVATDPRMKRLWELAARLEGTIGNCGTHAAGVIICDQPLMEHVGLYKASNSDIVATQFEMKYAEEIGLLKMDFLGLRTLTVVHKTVERIRKSKGIEIDIDNLEPNDAKTYALLRSGMTTGVFQLESSGMRDLARRIGLESLEEICALVALFRPGPMALKDDYIENKHNPSRIRYPHPKLEPILAETYGIALYQEQVMQIVQALAGFSLGQADLLRRAMGKKKADLMQQQGDQFVAGCEANGIDRKLAAELFRTIETFAGYGFNKSHSMAYAFVAYQTAYLKANYPSEFMAALLSSESGNRDKVAQYIEECRRMGIEVLPPDVNSSARDFTVVGNKIRFGMGAIKNVGDNAVEAIVNERANGPYRDVFDFCGRLDSRVTNRRIVESLNRAGAFDSTGWNRREVEESLEDALQGGQISQRERDAGQTSLFDLMAGEEGDPQERARPGLDEWPESELLAYEKEMMGLYVSSHPLARHASILERYSTIRASELPDLRNDQEVVIGGMLTAVKHYTTKNGKRMAFATLDTLEGPCELTVFTDLYEAKAGMLVPDHVVMVSAKVNYRNDEAGLVAEDILSMDEVEGRLTRAVHVRLATTGLDESLVEQLAEALGSRPGRCDVYLHCITPERDDVTVHATSSCRVAPSPDLAMEVEKLLGPDCLWYSGGNGLPRHSD
jgi:DNA polymerase III subunit alpha